MTGDSILVQPSTTSGTNLSSVQWYEGRVHFVRRADVGLFFNPTFRTHVQALPSSALFAVRFKLNRHPLRRQHQALDLELGSGLGAPLQRILFPSPCDLQRQMRRDSEDALEKMRARIYNPLIAHNEAQLRAVSAITEQAAGSMPFIIFGP